ncbi:MAG TPA: SAM-dependent chlorinase/fluorinase [Thermoanaerobaculia bacterium]|jgi:S-adenosylmethionine hydrolase|nr:SAM-dependent chlorinase/fluorinase [Thermoanaerobaculia bacterium]
MPTITLLTDFGTRDPYVAAMKGVLVSRCSAPVVDLSHEIAPFDLLGAAFFLRDVVAYWPAGTIFVVVVDPGVGTSRRMIAVARDSRIFLAPDNGVLHFECRTGSQPAQRSVDAGPAESRPHTYSIENSALFLPNGSNTFHGRDRFAPVAAALANGLPLADLGPPIDDPVPLPYVEPVYEEERITGTVIGIDRFGNILTDIARLPFPPCARIGSTTIDQIARTYGEAAGLCFVVGSAGRLEIAMPQASAADLLHLRAGDRLDITKCRTE